MEHVQDHLIRKIEKWDVLSAEETQALVGSVSSTQTVPAQTELIRAGDRPTHSMLLVDGFAARCRHDADGARHITSFHISGDFVDLHGLLLKTMDHGILALTACTVALLPHEKLREISETLPHLTRLLWLSTLTDGAIHRAWLTAMGLSSTKRTARLICEMYVRLEAVGLAEGSTYRLPITQIDFGNALAISQVHTNRSLAELKETGLAVWRRGRVEILDWDRLRAFAEFDADYLSFHQEPR